MPSNPPAAAEPPSPFSASFDPNETPVQTPEGTGAYDGGLATPPASGAARGRARTDVGRQLAVGETAEGAEALWTQRLSMSFGAIADQIAAASRALASVPVPVPVPGPGPGESPSAAVGEGAVARASLAAGVRGEVAALTVRLEAVERAQEALGAQLQAVQETLGQLQLQLLHQQREDKRGKEKGNGVEEVALGVRDGAGGQGEDVFKTATEIALEELQKKVDGIVETIRLDQQRLYARLHNAAVTANKQQIMAPITASGKAPPNFPSTKGEFEHLTKERYEALLKAYNVPIKGDTNAKREALREFIGLTPAV